MVVPVEDMRELGATAQPVMPDGVEMPPATSRTRARSGRRSTRRCSSSSEQHRSTIVFVNNRRLAERLAVRLNELAEEEIARAHHGSLAREQRVVIEEDLKAGRIPCLVATSSLELGIDMGAVDLVIQVESPKSVARGLQRIGRAGHELGSVSKGRIFPKFRADLLESAVVARAMRGGEIEETKIPRNPLDVLAQQIVAISADAEIAVDDLHRLVRGAYPFADLSRAAARERARHARRPLSLRRVRRAAAADRLGPHRGRDPRPHRRAAARGHERRHDPRPRPLRRPPRRRRRPRRRARRGDGLRGAAGPDVHARRLDVADRGDHARPRARLAGARACPAPSRSGRARASAGPYELGEKIGRAARELVGSERREGARRGSATTTTSTRARRRTSSRSCASRRPRPASSRPTATIVVERFRDEIGDWRVCILTPFGGRVHAPWGMALAARLRDSLGLEAQSIWSDDGIALHLPEADAPPSLADLLIGAGRDRGARRRRGRADGALRRPLPRERLARAADPAPPPGPAHAALAAAAEGAEPAPGGAQVRLVPDRARDLPRVPAGRLRPARAEEDPARAADARARPRRGRDRVGLAVRLVAPLRLRRDVHVRGRHAAGRAARAGALARPRPAARAARPGGAARADRPGRARGGGGAAARQPARPRRAARRPAPPRRPARGRVRRGARPRSCSPSGARWPCGSPARSG